MPGVSERMTQRGAEGVRTTGANSPLKYNDLIFTPETTISKPDCKTVQKSRNGRSMQQSRAVALRKCADNISLLADNNYFKMDGRIGQFMLQLKNPN